MEYQRANFRCGADSAVPDAEAQRPVSDSKAARCGRGLTTGTFEAGTQPPAVLRSAQHDEGVYRLHSLT
jgi:hypothetical protein